MSDINLSISSSTNVLTSAVGSDEVNLALSSSTNVVATTIESQNSLAVEMTVGPKGAKGDTGDTGLTGPAGPTGATGAAGQGLISGGTENEFLLKNSATDYDLKWSTYTLPAADGDDGTVLTTDGAGAVSFMHPKTISEPVKNVSGGTLVKGTPVHVTGATGNQADVVAATASSAYPAHFVLNQDLNNNEAGLGIALGFINNVDVPDASIYSEGQIVYLGASGGWTTTKPTGTNAIQNLGVIIKVNTGGNKISGIVMGAGRSNDVPNIPNGQAWIGNASGVATPTTLATVATSGSYNDLSNQPTIPSGDIVDDTTPQLGGNLDVNGNSIVSASDGDIVIDPHGTGSIILKSNDIQMQGFNTITSGSVKLQEITAVGTNFIELKAPLSITADTTLTLPDGAGTNGQALKTNGSGTLSWDDVLSDTNPTIKGDLSIKASSPSNDGRIVMYENDGTNYVVIQAQDSLATNWTFALPNTAGTAGQVLETNGSGVTSWGDKTPADGWHGSPTRIKILPSDFVSDDGGRPVMIEDDSIGSNQLHMYTFGAYSAYAYIAIPTGFKATHAMIYGSDTAQQYRVYEGDINTKTIATRTAGTSIGTEATFTSDVTSDTTNYLIVEIQSDGETDEFYGGYITIAEV